MFKKNFERLCRDRGLYPSAVCEKIGLSRSTWSDWTDSSVPRRATLQKLADYLGVTVDDLLGDSKKEHEEKQDTSHPKGVRIPVLGRVAAGIPSEAIEDIDDWEEIPQRMAESGTYFALRIHGRSMEPRMHEGDVVIVRKQETVDSGDIAIVSVNGFEATCKKIMIDMEYMTLISLNEEFKPMRFTKQEVFDLPVVILGKVVELRVKL